MCAVSVNEDCVIYLDGLFQYFTKSRVFVHRKGVNCGYENVSSHIQFYHAAGAARKHRL